RVKPERDEACPVPPARYENQSELARSDDVIFLLRDESVPARDLDVLERHPSDELALSVPRVESEILQLARVSNGRAVGRRIQVQDAALLRKAQRDTVEDRDVERAG